jgi:hypothetical protein
VIFRFEGNEANYPAGIYEIKASAQQQDMSKATLKVPGGRAPAWSPYSIYRDLTPPPPVPRPRPVTPVPKPSIAEVLFEEVKHCAGVLRTYKLKGFLKRKGMTVKRFPAVVTGTA